MSSITASLFTTAGRSNDSVVGRKVLVRLECNFCAGLVCSPMVGVFCQSKIVSCRSCLLWLLQSVSLLFKVIWWWHSVGEFPRGCKFFILLGPELWSIACYYYFWYSVPAKMWLLTVDDCLAGCIGEQIHFPKITIVIDCDEVVFLFVCE